MATAKKFAPSNFQLAIGEWFKSYTKKKSDLIVVARAGTGKSTTALWAVGELLKARQKCFVLLTCFNRSVQRELGEKCRVAGYGRSVDVKTLHALGNQCIVKAGGKAYTIKEDKYRDIVKPLVTEINESRKDQDGWIPITAKEVVNLTQRARECLADHTSHNEVAEMAKKFAIGFTHEDHPEIVVDLAVRAMVIGTTTQKKVYDQTDMVWYPCIFAEFRPRWTWSVVVVDEAQDMSPAQIKLANMAVSRKYRGKLICIGDPCQAIYGWRGADSGVLDRMVEENGCDRLTLPVTYRCPQEVVQLIHKTYPELVADYESACSTEADIKSVKLDSLLAEASAGDMILSRVNAPLLKMALGFLKEGRPAKIRGRDFTSSLKSIMREPKVEKTADMLAWLAAYEAKELAALERADADESAYEAVVDRVQCVRYLAADHETVEEAIAATDELFTDRDDAEFITLSSVHRAKGLEADRVWVLWDTFNKRDTEEEKFIGYVALSRTKRFLRLVRG